MCLAQGPQRSDVGEARTRGPSVSSQALYHRATALPPCCAAHNFDGNAILQSIIAFPATFKDLMEPVFNQALKAGPVGFVTMYRQQSIKSYKHSRRG